MPRSWDGGGPNTENFGNKASSQGVIFLAE